MTTPLDRRLREWCHLWWDETLIIIGVSTAICLLVWGGWYLFQTSPAVLQQGIVRDHRYTAQYEERHDGGSTCYAYDKNGLCSFRVDDPDIHHTHCVGGCFNIQVEGCSNDRRGDKHCRKEWKHVGQSTYENCRSGRLWQRNEMECSAR